MLDYHRFKKINELFTQGRNEEARHLLMEMQSRCIALRDQMDALKNQVQEFEDIIFLSRSLYFERRFYWIRLADLKLGPFCPECYDRDGTLSKLTVQHDRMYCPYCGARHDRPARTETSAPAPSRSARRIPFAR